MSKKVADRLRAHQEEITRLWEERVREEIAPARGEAHPIIVDTLPLFIEEVAKALAAPELHRGSASADNTIPLAHGRERARLTGFSLEQLIREYHILRKVILETLHESGELPFEDHFVVMRSIDDAILQSVVGFSTVERGIRDQFVATLTHDLRGPLTSIKAGAQMIFRHPDQLERHQLLSARIVESVDRADRMIQNLLDVTRLRAGERLSMKVAPCELQALLQDIVIELVSIHGDRFRIRDDGSITGCWNAEELRRAFHNLLSNAVKYGTPDRPITITSIRVPEADRALVTVHNWGNPISVEDQATIFHYHRRTSEALQSGKKGWGLGLALVRGVVEAHGGSISIRSNDQEGTSFIVDLPRDSSPFINPGE